MRTIGVITSGRSDYGIYRPLLQKMVEEKSLQLHLVVAGMHLLPKFGLTIEEIKKDGFAIAETISLPLEEDTPEGIAKAQGVAIQSFGKSFAKQKPDILLVLGDRFEMHAAALSALPFRIPVAHIHGGELTLGAIDNALRYSITMLSHLHFVATETYRRRVLQLGEESWRVHVTGAPALDALKHFEPMTLETLSKRFDLPLTKRPILVTYHPVTLEYEDTDWQVGQLLLPLENFSGPIVFTAPNADTSNTIVWEKITTFIKNRKQTFLIPNFGPDYYFQMLANAAVMVGNSSSGLLEAPSFALPVVNIGSRQAGRVRAKNVIDVDYTAEAILTGIQKALSKEFRESLLGLRNPYDAGGAANKIIDCLKSLPLSQKLIFKKFTDRDFNEN